MSILHLIGVDAVVEFDGKAIDKAVTNIQGYSNNKFDEDSVDQANDTLSDIESETKSIDTLEQISNNVSCLREEAENMFEREVKSLQSIKAAMDMIEKSNTTDDFLWEIHAHLCDAQLELTDNGNSHHIISKYQLTNQDISFDFIPNDLFYDYSPRAGGDVYYKNDKWKINVSTYVGYSSLKMTPKSLSYNGCIYKDCYDKMIELGITPKNVSELDLQLLKIVDNHNVPLYTLFHNHLNKDKD